MYETEANHTVEPLSVLPPEVIASFGALTGKIVARSVLPWSEHCTECVWPTCYTSCDLYAPREDGRCRRFVDGMVRINCPEAVNRYLLKIRFKQWGKLWTPGSLDLRPAREAARIESRDYRIGTVLYQLPMPEAIRNVAVKKRYGMKKRLATRSSVGAQAPTSFLVECFNPNDRAIGLSLTIRSMANKPAIPFQQLIKLAPGFQVVRIASRDISATIDLSVPFGVELTPNDFDKEITLYFGLMDFVTETAPQAAKNGGVKCVVWDLDHTLWDGVLVEDGADTLQLKPGMREIIEQLDRRGILQSVASKNTAEEALAVLKRLGIEEYFLYPQVSWGPKGEAVKKIAQRLNIGLDSLLFVDDQQFERSEVESSCPGVRVVDARQYEALLERPDCIVPVTAESAARRQMYQVEKERQEIQESFKDDYKAFLKHCDIRLTISELSEQNLERVHELTQRTNQMNFSGTRYDRAVLAQVLRNPSLDTYVLSCEDRFGSYGIVGFGIVENREPRLTDLMFSCRIQSKRVEHAFLRSIIERHLAPGRDFHANYRKTPRNAPSGKVFADLGMQETTVADGVTSLVFPGGAPLPDDGIIAVTIVEECLAVGRG